MAKKIDINRLASCVQYARMGMLVFREEDTRIARRLAGNRYNHAVKQKTFINLVSLYDNIFGRALISNNPRALISTFSEDNRPVVDQMQAWANDHFEKINLANPLKRIVRNAIRSIGICKIGIATPEDEAVSAHGVQSGWPFVSSIDLNDFVFDIEAKDFDQVQFIGHRFRVPRDIIMDSPRYNASAKKYLETSENRFFNAEGDEQIGQIGRSNLGEPQDLFDMVDLWEIYVPRYKMIYTLADSTVVGAYPSTLGRKSTPLAEREWIGPYCGPIRTLGLGDVSGNPFPKGPILDVIDLDEAANHFYRKLIQQAQDQKSLLFCSGNQEDADRINKTPTGKAVFVAQPDKIKEFNVFGPNQGIFTFLQEIINRFSWLSGNLETIGGLGSQANTATQEELLAKQSNGQVAAMQAATGRFVELVVQDLLWWHWHHPSAVYRTQYATEEARGLASVTRELHPWNKQDEYDQTTGKMRTFTKRDIPWEELAIVIEPYSIQYQTPSQHAAMITQFVTQIYAPLAQVAQQSGIVLDFKEFVGTMAKLMNQPDLGRIIKYQEPMMPDQNGMPGAGHERTMAPQTSREYVRRDVGNDTTQARDAANSSVSSEQMNGELAA